MKQKFIITLLMTASIYLLITLPHLIAYLTLDNGNYFGLIYPNWLVFTCSFISVILGNLIVRNLNIPNE